jgi:formylglycine-generating enzyme required for sulfatase activity
VEILKDNPELAKEIQSNISISAGDGSLIARDINRSKVALGSGAQVAEQIFNIRNETSPADSKNEKKENPLRAYLQSLQKFCYLLPLATLGDDKEVNSEITLDHFYIQLDTTSPKEDPENATIPKRKGDSSQFIRDREQAFVSVMEATRTENKLVLLGIAGSGKSTFVKKLLGLQAASLLSNEQKPIEGFDLDLIPVYLELRKLSPRLSKLDLNLPNLEKNRVLSDTILEQVYEEAQDATEAIPALKKAFYDGNLLLVLDGLDETPQELRQVVQQAVAALIKLWGVKRIIVTSRFTEETAFANFKEYAIAQLTDEKIRDFVSGWYNEQVRIKRFSREEADKRTKDLAEKALENLPREMSSNPMTLTSIALIHTNGTELPRQRVELYSRLVNIFTGKWEEARAGREAYPENLRAFFEDKNRLRRTLEYLAYETHCANYRAEAKEKNSVSADLAYGDALVMLERPEYLGSPDQAKAFLKYMHERAGLFTSKSGASVRELYYGFVHRAIQEYLAGCYMIAQEEPCDLYLEKAAQQDFWSRPALMGAEEIIYNQDKAWPQLRSLMNELCPSSLPDGEQHERALLWAGQIAAEYGKDNIEHKWKQGKGEEYLARLLAHTLNLFGKDKYLPPRERAEAGDVLAKLGDPRLGVQNDFIFCRIPKGKFWMGSKKGDEGSFDSEYLQFEYPIAEDYFMLRYPITNAQFNLFVQTDGYKAKQYWDAAIKAGYWSEDGFKGRYDNEARIAPISYSAPFNLPNHPVVGVSWYEAVAFCKWLTVQIQNYELGILNENSSAANHLKSQIVNRKTEIRLPAEAEWERAARGGKSQRYPWGDEITPNHANFANTNINATSAVGAFPLGTNDYGLLDMSGNVWEWCATQWQENYKNYLEKEQQLNNLEGDSARVVRGGSCGDAGVGLRCAFRDWGDPSGRGGGFGFRVVVCAVSPISP